MYDEALNSFFRNTDVRYAQTTIHLHLLSRRFRHGVTRDIPLGEGKGKIRTLKARVSSVQLYRFSPTVQWNPFNMDTNGAEEVSF